MKIDDNRSAKKSSVLLSVVRQQGGAACLILAVYRSGASALFWTMLWRSLRYKKTLRFLMIMSLILASNSALVSVPSRPTHSWSARTLGMALKILFSTALSEILQESCHLSNLDFQALHWTSVISSSREGMGAFYFAPPAPPPPPSPPPFGGWRDAIWLAIAWRMSFRSVIPFITAKSKSACSQSLSVANSAGLAIVELLCSSSYPVSSDKVTPHSFTLKRV